MQDDNDLGTSGRKRSGEARMSMLTTSERRELGKRAAAKRWEVQKGQVITPYEADAWGDLPIIGHVVPCAVIMIEGEPVRLVSERELVKSFGGKRGGSHWLRARDNPLAANLPPIISAVNLQPFIGEELRGALATRYPYKVPGRGGFVAHGLRGELYPMICDVFLKARDAKALLGKGQEEMAVAADILMRALAHTGIIALIDEATGFQTKRAVDGLARILQAFIAKELQPYIPTFQPDFYEHLFRLRGLDYKTDSVKRPQYFGYLTNDIVYRRLAPGVLAELKKVLLRNDAGRPTHKYFQRLTANLGYPKLREHLGAVVAIMKLSSHYPDFIAKLDRVAPRYGQNWLLPFNEDDADSGVGL